MSEDVEQRIYRIFDPAGPLHEEQMNLYVELDPVRGDADVVNGLAKRIELSDSETCQAITGHRGSGKSTELLRLKKKLEDDKWFVVFCECRKDVDFNDVDFPDVMISILRQMAEQLKDREEISLKPGYFKDRLGRFKELLFTEIDLEKISFDAGLLKLTTALKSGPDMREEIRKALEPDTANWIDAANEYIGVAIDELTQRGYNGLVIIVDDLDKMITRPMEKGEFTTSEHLFIIRHSQISAFKCHTIFTMPLELVYSHKEPEIANRFGGHPCVIPMTKIREKPPSKEEVKEGMDKFRELIQKRLEKAEADSKDVFEEGIEDQLIRLSGGQPSELMIIIREALISKGLPITSEAVKRVERAGREAYRRQIRSDYWPILEEVKDNGIFTRTIDREVAIRELLDSRAILQYINEEEWYALNPYIIELENPDKP